MVRPTPGRLLTSAFIVFFIVATVVAAIPDPTGLERLRGERYSSDDRVSRHVRPALDVAQRATERLTLWAWRVTAPLQRPLRSTVRRMRLAQRWQMFAQPPRSNTFMAIRLEAQMPTGQVVSKAVRVLPAREATEVRPFALGRPEYRDKALSNCLEAWEESRLGHSTGDEDRETEYGKDILGRIGRFFEPRVASTLPRGASVTRTEVWFGFCPMTPRGEPEETSSLPPLTQLPNGAELGRKVTLGRANWTLRRVIAEDQR